MPRARTEIPRATRVADVRKGDTVVVLHGKDAGKRGTVEHIVRPDRLVVEGLNIAKRHTKPRRIQGRTESTPRIQQGGILDKPLPLYMGNVMVVCPACSRPTRVKHAELATGKSVRVCGHCGEPLTREVRA